MYLNKSIQLDETKLPQILKDDFCDLEKFYDAGDWFNYGILLENSVPSIKASFANGNIDSNMFSLIRKKFGIV